MGIIIEHFAGRFPFWISPKQVGIVPVHDEHLEYAQKIANDLKSSRIRVEVDTSSGTMGNKIKRFRHELIPYILIVGEKEMENNTISLRVRTGAQVNNIALESFVKGCKEMVTNHALDLLEVFD
jgi:threonyl-tRNA synthetase